MQTRWLSGNRPAGVAGGAGAAGAPNPMRTPDVENMDMDTYARNLNAMNDSLHDLQGDIQRLASQQSQIQQMMGGGGGQQQQQQHHPQAPPPPSSMDPQPFYIAPDHPGHHQLHHPHQQPLPPQRRTWGQPQPIHFAHQQHPPPHHHPHMGAAGDQSWSPRRQQWGQRPPPQMGYGGPASPYGPGAGGDPYYSGGRGPIYNGGGASPYDPQSGMYGGGSNHSSYSPGYGNPPVPGYGGSPYQPHGPAAPPAPGGVPFNSQYGSPSGARMNSPNRAAPFRLHDTSGGGASPAPSSVGGQRTSFGASPVRQQQQQEPPMSPTSTVPLAESSPLSRQLSRDSVNSAPPVQAPVGLGARLHTSVPAPGEDDMAPQNISFIEEEKAGGGKKGGGDDDRGSSESPPLASGGDEKDSRLKRLPERLSQLNISSGSKTYRVHQQSSDKEASPSPAATATARPTISSAFKQSRRSSGGESPAPGSGPSSLRSNPARTEEEEETLANMKTERLKDDKDASAGFVISFEDDAPKRAKPELKQRRPSMKRTSLSGQEHNPLASDGSSSSRKENVPPEVMICIVSCTPRFFTSFHYFLLSSVKSSSVWQVTTASITKASFAFLFGTFFVTGL